MSAKDNVGDYYAETAYIPIKRQRWEAENPERDTIIGSRLSWDRQTRDNGTKEEYGYNNIAISQSWEDQRERKKLEGDDTFKAIKVCYDHKRIMPPNYKAVAKIFYMIMAFGKGFFHGHYFLCFFLLLDFIVFNIWKVGF
ncbi:hypothetical protein [Billgrantia antri]|uniref:Uncharacterized protein n=1 Tax=Billgrantia antri TaxID=2846777 RepID=A0ABS6ZU87_9GAMM|nr:hypothetical protein [Halomonas antri]MBW6392600.1 hypothetical protein [Halomonas antri]